jgi:hypothetical protein
MYIQKHIFYKKFSLTGLKSNQELFGDASENGQRLDILIETVGSI